MAVGRSSHKPRGLERTNAYSSHKLVVLLTSNQNLHRLDHKTHISNDVGKEEDADPIVKEAELAIEDLYDPRCLINKKAPNLITERLLRH